jgi:hypothetical protein
LWRLHHKAKTVDASFDPLAEPSTTRETWEKMRDNLEKGMPLNILNFDLEPTSIAEVNAKRAFVDILDNGIIKPLATFKVYENISFVCPSDNRRPGRKQKMIQ